MTGFIRWFGSLSSDDVAEVGGKNASLGEMISRLRDAGIRVPTGFATTADAYWAFLDENDLRDHIVEQIDQLHDGAPLAEVGTAVRDRFTEAELPMAVREAITEAYKALAGELGEDDPGVAVRSSATAEDLPEASFAGQQESFLNVSGVDELLGACVRCYASLFTDRAINYREDHGFDHRDVALSVGVQQMVRSDTAGAGVMFTIDTETGFPDTTVVSAAWGLGESVVGGGVEPDEYVVFTPLLDDTSLRPVIHRRIGEKAERIVYAEDGSGTRSVATDPEERRRSVLDDDEVLTLARWGARIEAHYGTPMDIEWAKDGGSGELFIVQARPETVQTRRSGAVLRTYELTGTGTQLVEGVAIGDAIATGPVCRLESAADIDQFVDGAVLVTGITDPDWEPIMRRASALVTDHGGRTSHAAIVSRELGLAAIVGAGDATEALDDGREVTVSCAEGDRGIVYDGELDHEVHEVALEELPRTRTKLMLNLAQPAAALRWWRLPAAGVGLTRIEFIVADDVGIHPMALACFDQLDDDVREQVAERTAGFEDDRGEFLVDRLASGVARIAASRWPDPVVVRLSDFKTNEYAQLLGGAAFEPAEENPMIGWRGASRYTSDGYRPGFALECRAMRKVRDEMGLTNVQLMVPFCRTPEEADLVLEELATNGLVRGRNGLEILVMAELPSNVILADEFAARFDGFSIGSNDLAQLTLGVDRDADVVAHLFDESHPACTRSIETLIDTAHRAGVTVGLCGERPSSDLAFADFLVRAGIDSISVAPDSYLSVSQQLARTEAELDGNTS